MPITVITLERESQLLTSAGICTHSLTMISGCSEISSVTWPSSSTTSDTLQMLNHEDGWRDEDYLEPPHVAAASLAKVSPGEDPLQDFFNLGPVVSPSHVYEASLNGAKRRRLEGPSDWNREILQGIIKSRKKCLPRFLCHFCRKLGLTRCIY